MITFIEQIIGKNVVIGEESGGWSKKSCGPASMSIVLIETCRSYEFARISEHYPRNTRGTHDNKELKWISSSDRIRKKVLRDIAELEPYIHIATDERKDLDIGNIERYQTLFSKLVKDLMTRTYADRLDFVMDETPLMKMGRGKEIVTNIAKNLGKNVAYKHVRSVDSPLVQTQDFVAGAANRSRMGEGRFIEKVNKNIVSCRIEK
jgi:hypothetical protein